jgi:ubiquinone/menaquinone biosynthesis C-methylase UbiE
MVFLELAAGLRRNSMSFDRLARHYSWMESVLAGQRLHRCRTAFLKDMRNCHSALLAGEGHGRFLIEFRGIAPDASVCCVEQSPKMIAVAKEKCRRAGYSLAKISFIETPLQQFESDQTFDLIATHFFLDCFEMTELESVINKLEHHMRPGGKWVISDFQLPAKGWRAMRARLVLKLAYAFFRVATKLPARSLVPPQPLLIRNGLRILERAQFNFDLLYAELWEKPALAA